MDNARPAAGRTGESSKKNDATNQLGFFVLFFVIFVIFVAIFDSVGVTV